jgi:hypothetical protein
VNITTKQTGEKILAKGGGKQRTITADPAQSVHANHGAAAGVLASVHGVKVGPVTIAVDAHTRTGRFSV